MRNKKKDRKPRTGGLIAVLVLLGIFAFEGRTALEIARHADNWLQNFDLFQLSVSVAALVAGALFAVFCAALCAAHWELIASCLIAIRQSKVLRHLLRHHGEYGQFIRSIAAALVAISVILQMNGRPNILPAPSASATVDNQTYDRALAVSAEPTAVETSNEGASAVVAMPQPRPRMAGRDPCDLEDDFTSNEFRACRADIAAHPNRTGTGGKIYIRTKEGGRWAIKPLPSPPLPRPRPPFDIRPVQD